MASFGDKLRRERELRGIDLREIAEATKISLRFLQALEEDRVDVLPGGLFPRAFVRQYAHYLGLDPERLVSEFVYLQGEPPPAPVAPRPRAGRRRSAFLVPALVLVAGLFALKGMGPHAERAAGPSPTPLPPPVVVPTDRVYPPPTAPSTEAAAVPETRHLVLTLNATQSCWVAAQVDGQTILNRILNEGETETLTAEGEIVLSVGNAGGIAISINDRPPQPLGRSGEVRKNIVINKDTAGSIVEHSPPLRASRSS